MSEVIIDDKTLEASRDRFVSLFNIVICQKGRKDLETGERIWNTIAVFPFVGTLKQARHQAAMITDHFAIKVRARVEIKIQNPFDN